MIKITAEFLINRRKMQWESHHDIRKDEYFVKGVAYEITQNDELREEIIDDPSKLIELCFTVVNKKFSCNLNHRTSSNLMISVTCPDKFVSCLSDQPKLFCKLNFAP